MKHNPFLRSTFRQPGKALCLVLVTALAAFAFVSRASEYLLIAQETERLAEYYAAIGTLVSATGDPWADTHEAAAWLEENPYVQTVNTYDCTIGVIQEDICNADTDNHTNTSESVCFMGTLLDWSGRTFYFQVDEVLCGYPERVEPGRRMAVVWSGNGIDSGAVEAAYAALERGERYLVQTLYYPFAGSRVEYDGAGNAVTTFVNLLPLSQSRLFCPVPEDGALDWTGSALSALREKVQVEWDIQHSLNVIAVRDMGALPMTRDTAQGIRLAGGRWLTAEDDRQGSPLCAVNEAFAALRGLEVGDTLTLELRDLPSTFGYFDNETGMPYDVAVEQSRKAVRTYEIVGIYGHLASYPSTFVRNDVYVPASTVPEDFAMSYRDPERDTGISDYPSLFDYRRDGQSGGGFDSLPRPGTVSFVLTGPEEKAAFMAENREALAKLGFRVSLPENNWENFQAAAGPLERSALLGTVLFGGILAAALGVVVLAYLRMRWRELPIVRSLGVPAAVCVRQVSAPLLGLGLAGVLSGGALGWRYTMAQGTEKLEGLRSFGSAAGAALGPGALVALLGGSFAALAALTVGSAAVLFRKPVLVLLQGGRAAKAARTVPAAVLTGSPAKALEAERTRTMSIFRPKPLTAQKIRRPGMGPALRFAWRQVVRSKGKTAVTIALAAGFTAGLATMELSVLNGRERAGWLYEHTSVEAELTAGEGNIRADVLDALLDTGYAAEKYLEGASPGALIRYTPGMEEGPPSVSSGKKMPDQAAVGDDVLSVSLRAIGDVDTFLTPAGSGSRVTISYLDGWDGSLFGKDWTGVFPVVLPKELYDEYGGTIALSWKGFHICEVAGYYTGSVDGGGDSILLPLGVYQRLGGHRTSYSKVHLWLDPALNRDLSPFLRAAEDAVQSGLEAVVWDEELRMVTAPLEQSVELTEALYPVVFALSVLTAAGTAVLLTLLNTKHVAILRVQGTGRGPSAAILLLQQVFPTLAGLALGAAGSFLLAGRAVSCIFLCTALYLAAGTSGAAVSAVIILNRKPMELLQVKE